jgi:hypothetical protein
MWVNPGQHHKTWVTRKVGEGLTPEHVVDKKPEKIKRMFCGSFSASLKGPGIFSEKDWGFISSQTYRDHAIPVIHGQMCMNPGLVLVQDGAPGHSAKDTQVDLNERGIYFIFWPAFSLDLNPTETVWDRMKDYIERRYPEDHFSYHKLGRVVKEAWETVGADELLALVREMPARCEAVIDAQGGHTKC